MEVALMWQDDLQTAELLMSQLHVAKVPDKPG